MFTAYVVVSVLLAAMLAASAGADFVRYQRVLDVMTKAGVPHSWLTMLGVLKSAGALGLLVGLGIPVLGTAAAVGVILFFIAAIVTHLRVHDYAIALPAVFGLLAVAALVLGLDAPRGGA